MSDADTPYLRRNGRFLPQLRVTEWILYALLAAGLAVINIYTTLLVGWGDNGSIISVLASVLVLRTFAGRLPDIPTLNLGQTMASAGGAIGFAVATYAAVHIAEPDFHPSWVWLGVLFAGMGVVGCIIGATVRKYMVRYFWPSGTACAVIQRTLTETDVVARARPLRIMSIFGGLSALLTIPTKIEIPSWKDGALIKTIELHWKNLGLGVEPLLYGIGIVVGPRVGLGMIIGGAIAWIGIPDWWQGSDSAISAREWGRWVAIAVLTLPTFATILFAYLFKHQAQVPGGFTPGATEYRKAPRHLPVFGGLAVIGVMVTAVAADQLFDLPWYIVVLTFVLAFPMCVVNGRVNGDTDINPIRLVAIVLLAALAWTIDSGVVAMLGMAVIGGTLAGLAVDLMQDQRTGYLLDCNPHHQTSILCIGTVIGTLAAIPFFAMLIGQLSMGEGGALPAPGAQVWATMARAFEAGMPESVWLWRVVIMVSLGGALYAFLSVWPVTGAWMPSLFGIGIGMLLPFEQSAAIFGGGVIHWVVKQVYGAARRNQAQDDCMLVGSSIFAVSAVVSVLLILVTTLMKQVGVDWFRFAS
ncbi:MAG TPA: OPT/YSL family transporter [Kofleriaceae bacterium]|nr:OPT/YSL family transporter [Kofleriaceae bacterium]